jgi:sulfur-oxidizing protein SoxZ
VKCTRVRVPASVKAGDIIEIRAILHPMENGFRVDTQGTTIPVHIITEFVCS